MSSSSLADTDVGGTRVRSDLSHAALEDAPDSWKHWLLLKTSVQVLRTGWHFSQYKSNKDATQGFFSVDNIVKVTPDRL